MDLQGCRRVSRRDAKKRAIIPGKWEALRPAGATPIPAYTFCTAFRSRQTNSRKFYPQISQSCDPANGETSRSENRLQKRMNEEPRNPREDKTLRIGPVLSPGFLGSSFP